MLFKRIILPVLTVILLACESQYSEEKGTFTTPYEASGGISTATYEEAIDFYMELAREYPEISIQTIGETDSGLPLHIVTYNPQAEFNFQKLSAGKTVILINNGIHPGESDGIDASMLLFRDLAQNILSPPKNTVVVTIPVYNIGGALNRNSRTRVNQNGPESYGFRGNARNYDLNRDFIKNDTKNARSFARIFQMVKPDIFIDNHVSNGADYQYILSHVFTQHNKLGGDLGTYLEGTIRPALEKSMKEMGNPVTPYVNIFNAPPDHGFSQFMDHPRYSSGYAALWNTFSVMTETHMLKPYEQRVKATYDFMVKFIELSDSETERIKKVRDSARTRPTRWSHYPHRWKLDSTHTRTLEFKGFQADTIISEVTGHNRLKYNRDVPFTKEVPYFDNYVPADSVRIPEAYIIGREWQKVTDLMTLHGIELEPLEKDTILQVESYRIEKYETSVYPYEGHYPHFDTEVSASTTEIQFSEGDFLIRTDQEGFRFILETLEPEAVDSFFNWNFFDTVLQQKEGFSPYVFEDLALEILENNAVLRDSFELKKEIDPVFAADWYAQLQWIFLRSEHYEKAHLQYPVYRLLKK